MKGFNIVIVVLCHALDGLTKNTNSNIKHKKHMLMVCCKLNSSPSTIMYKNTVNEKELRVLSISHSIIINLLSKNLSVSPPLPADDS